MLLYTPAYGYVQLHLRFLEWIGFVPLLDPTVRFYRCRVAFRYAVNAVMLLAGLSSVLFALKRIDDLQKFSLSLFNIIGLVHSFIFAVSLGRNYPAFREHVVACVDRYFREHVDVAPHSGRVRKHAARLQRMLYLNKLSVFVITFVMYWKEMAGAGAAGDERPMPMPVDFFLKNRLPLKGYYALFLLALLVLENMNNYYTGTVSINFSLIIYIYDHLESLKYKIGRILYEVPGQESSFRPNWLSKYKSIVKEHNRVIRLLKEYNRIVSPWLAFLNFTNVQFYSLIMIIIMTQDDVDMRMLSLTIAILAVLLVLHFIWSSFGSYILYSSTELKRELYFCGWEDLDPDLRKLFLIPMMNLNKQLKLSAGIFGNMSLDLFFSLIQFSYSLFTLLSVSV